jgi:hypothetical protein
MGFNRIHICHNWNCFIIVSHFTVYLLLLAMVVATLELRGAWEKGGGGNVPQGGGLSYWQQWQLLLRVRG